MTCNLSDAFIQSNLQLIRLSRRYTPWSNVGLSCADLIVARSGIEPPTLQIQVKQLKHYATGCPWKNEINFPILSSQHSVTFPLKWGIFSSVELLAHSLSHTTGSRLGQCSGGRRHWCWGKTHGLEPRLPWCQTRVPLASGTAWRCRS